MRRRGRGVGCALTRRQSCVAGACAPGQRRLCVPGSAMKCCACVKLRSGPWCGGGGKDLACRANIMHSQCNKGQTMLICISQPFALEMASKIGFDAQRNAAASFARISFACDGNRARTCNGEKTRDEKRVRRAQQKTCQSHEFHDHVAGAARGPRETYTTTGGR